MSSQGPSEPHPVRITACLFFSLDGRTSEPQTWHFDHVDAQLIGAVEAQYAAADRILLGRRTYESFAASWGFRAQNSTLAKMINRMPKVVVSNTLVSADWPHSTLLTGDLSGVVATLRRGPGHLVVPGSVALVRSLLLAGALDRLELMVHPRVVGRGDRLFDGDGPGFDLDVVSNTTFGTGVQHIVYEIHPQLTGPPVSRAESLEAMAASSV